MTKLILVRHAEAEGNILRRFHGVTDSGVTENGYRQLEKLASRIKDDHIDILFSSDLIRAYETAKAISKVKNLDINVVECLREIDGGEWEDKTWNELELNWYDTFKHWEESPHLLEIPGGESMVHFQKRVVACVDELINNNKEKNICIVTHGTVIKVLLCHYYGKELCDLEDITWHDNTSISVVEVIDENIKVVLDGDNKHLGDLSTLAKQDWWKKTMEDNK